MICCSFKPLLFDAFFVNDLGWALCREEGKAIADLAARQDNPLDGFGIFGLVKEVGVDDEGEENILSLVEIEFQANLNQYLIFECCQTIS